MGTYRTVTKIKSFDYPITLVCFILTVVVFLLVFVIPFFIVFAIFFFLSFVGIVISLFNFTEIRKFRGKFDGSVEFHEDCIVVKGKEYIMDDIQLLVFKVSDFRGKIDSPFLLDPIRSNGTNNYVELKMISGEKKKVYFQLYDSKQFLENRSELISYYKHRKISFLRLIDLLKIKKYEDIQEFKREIGIA